MKIAATVSALAVALASACGDSGDSDLNVGKRDAAQDAETVEQGDAAVDAAQPDAAEPATPPSLSAGGDCPALVGSGVEHNSDVTGSETWTAAAGPHRVTATLSVKGTLTVEACARVILSKGVSMYIGSSSDAGRLITKGEFSEASATSAEQRRPVVFTSAAADQYWGMLFVNGLGHADFRYTVLQRGGDSGAISTSRGGALVVRGPNDGSLRRMVAAQQLLVLDSGGFGVTLESGAGFEESAAASLLVQGTGKLPKPAGYGADIDPVYPVYVEPPGLGSLPEGLYRSSSDGVASENDKILVVPRLTLTGDEQFHDRGVPYLIKNSSFSMRPAVSATLTIDPGVTLRFHHDPSSGNRIGMTLGDGASIDPRPVLLSVVGTAQQPIVFTSDSAIPAAGDWSGLYLDMSPSAGNRLSHARVLYAGADSLTSSYGCGPGDNDAAILITDWRPDDAFITNVEIANSAAGGIMSGWRSDSDGPELKSGNTFSAIANGCAVSRWQNATGLACPGRTDVAPLCL